MNISDAIALAIQEMLQECGGEAQIKRNEFAVKLGCVPSQINYVLTSRFTPEQGYIVESRRGGGGYIRITKISDSKKQLISHILQSVGDTLEEQQARLLVDGLYQNEMLSKREARIMLSALSDRTLQSILPKERSRIRACVFKSMLCNI